MELEWDDNLRPAPRQPNTAVNVVIGQIRPKKSDYGANVARIGSIFRQLAETRTLCDVLALPETALSGYFLEGGVRELAVTREQLYSDIAREFAHSGFSRPLDVVVGFYEMGEGKYYNSALYAELHPDPTAGRIVHVHRKFFLPTYGVFDEKRFVSRGRSLDAFETRFGTCAVLICEDVWHSISATIAALKGAQIVYVITASPGRGFAGEVVDNAAKYRELLVAIAEEHNVYVVNSSLVGFEGGKGFIGHSVAVNPFGDVIVEGPLAEEALLTASLALDDVSIARSNSPLLGDLEASIADIALELRAVAERKGGLR